MASLVDTRHLNGLGNLNIGTNVDIKRTDDSDSPKIFRLKEVCQRLLMADKFEVRNTFHELFTFHVCEDLEPQHVYVEGSCSGCRVKECAGELMIRFPAHVPYRDFPSAI
ncbi:unnamed protein product [Notodromas monacha]|uniref:Uncharacterized protein n=1 Tax=Notodromas monacha TaxID=399045 RepID=A0A7R9BIV0_9CRUS|nr:unnamed protein product [Notodromas monacha]CAG0915432.1 unnamed protein product [Notodromas monacha]